MTGKLLQFLILILINELEEHSLPSLSFCGRKHIELMHQIILYLHSLKDGWDWHNNDGFSKRE